MHDTSKKITIHLSILGLETADLPEHVDKLIKYIELIDKWNRVHNLTSVRNPEKMLTHHITDSLAVLPHLAGSRLADIGSGAGLPGIPIAILRPNWEIVLIESNQKKCTFLQQVVFELGLNNIKVVIGRAEEFQPNKKFNIVICRALCTLEKFILLTGHLLDDGSKENKWVVMKGVNPKEELNQLPKNYFVEKVVPVSVPGLDAQRHLIFIKKKIITN